MSTSDLVEIHIVPHSSVDFDFDVSDFQTLSSVDHSSLSFLRQSLLPIYHPLFNLSHCNSQVLSLTAQYTGILLPILPISSPHVIAMISFSPRGGSLTITQVLMSRQSPNPDISSDFGRWVLTVSVDPSL